MWCAVCNCRNNNDTLKNIPEELSFHRFPSNPKLLRKWIIFCKRKSKFNTKTSRICSDHFLKEDFANYLQYEMKLSERLLLKNGTVPTIYEKSESVNSSNRSKRHLARTTKKLVSSLLQNQVAESSANVVEENDDHMEFETIYLENDDTNEVLNEDKNEVLNEDTMIQVNEDTMIQVKFDALKTEIETLKCENVRLKNAEENYQDEIATLKIELQKSEFRRINVENKFMDIFTPEQVKNKFQI